MRYPNTFSKGEVTLRNIMNNIQVDDDINLRTAMDKAIIHAYGPGVAAMSADSYKAILVNCVRHEYTSYNSKLRRVNRLGKYRRYRNSTLAKIGQKYPGLQEECEKQMRDQPMCRIVKR